jgi:hypothetical protein
MQFALSEIPAERFYFRGPKHPDPAPLRNFTEIFCGHFIKPAPTFWVQWIMDKFGFSLYQVLLFISLISGVSAQPESTGARYRVSLFLLEDCKISKDYIPELQRLYRTYANDSIEFEGLFPAPSTEESAMGDFVHKYALPWPCRLDPDQAEARRLGIHVMPEVAVWRTDTRTLLYRGRIDNRWADIGKRRARATRRELEDCLEAISKGQAREFRETKAIGCILFSGE